MITTYHAWRRTQPLVTGSQNDIPEHKFNRREAAWFEYVSAREAHFTAIKKGRR